MSNTNTNTNSSADVVYLEALKDVLETGEIRKTRNATTISKFGIKLDFDVKETFPLLTTKKMFWKGIVEELLWFLRSDTDSKILEKKGVNIWKGNSSKEYLESIRLHNREEGDCGPIYGFQWRHFNAEYIDCHTDYSGKGHDQLQKIIDEIKKNPSSRRLFMSGWNPCQESEMVLPPCHVSYQFYVSGNELSCMMYQRSGDMFLGVPFNIASSALLLYLICKMTDLVPSKLSIVIGDAHIYDCHIESVKTQLERTPYSAPQLTIEKKLDNIESYVFEDFSLLNYNCHSGISSPMIP
jgi:dihydrofolate reductase/thymidylate synthase